MCVCERERERERMFEQCHLNIYMTIYHANIRLGGIEVHSQYLVNSPFFYREMGDFQTICKIQHINFVEVNLP